MGIGRTLSSFFFIAVLLTSCTAPRSEKVQQKSSTQSSGAPRFEESCLALQSAIQNVTSVATRGIDATLILPLQQLLNLTRKTKTSGAFEEGMKSKLISNTVSVISDLVENDLKQSNWNLQFDQMTAAYAYCAD